MTGLHCWLLQAASDPVGPAGWNFRNWLGLGCQVVVFILLVAFIFWLADLKNAGPEAEGEPSEGEGDTSPQDPGDPPTPAPALVRGSGTP